MDLTLEFRRKTSKRRNKQMTDEVFSLGKLLSSLTFEDVKVIMFIIVTMYVLVSLGRFFDRLNGVSDIEEDGRDTAE